MGGVFKKPKTPKVEKPVAPSTEDPAIEEARRAEQLAQQKARGRAATLLTGADGDTAEPTVQRRQLKRLLGD